MRQPPKNNIARDAIKVWRIVESLFALIVWLAVIAFLVVSLIFDFPLAFAGLAFLAALFITYLFVYLFPKIRFRRWRYEVFEQEIYIQQGILIEKRTLVPMIRVQHVDTKQGPFLKKYHLASLTISTAATIHEIPALLEEDAAELRDRISALARVDEDDV